MVQAQMTHREIIRYLGGASTQLAADHIRRLQAKGLLAPTAKGATRARSHRLTERGLTAIGLRPCRRCKGSGYVATASCRR